MTGEPPGNGASGDRAIVLVEPSAWMRGGHYREKLNLWISGFQELGYRPRVATSKPVGDWDGQSTEFITLPGWQARLASSLPEGLRQYVLMSFCYAMAIREARRNRCPLMGLSTRGAIPLYFGSVLAGFRSPPGWGTCIMQYREEKSTGPVQRMSFERASRNGCHFLFNLPQNYDRLNRNIAAGRGHFSPDPILVSKIDRERRIGPRPFRSLFISGTDNDRRDAFQLAREVRLEERFPLLRLQFISDSDPRKEEFDGLAEEVDFCNRFYFMEEFADLFRTSDAVLISYSPKFAAGSANLVSAIVHGCPVLMSRFPAAEAVAATYGRVGEFFDYGDREGFVDAVRRLRAWGEPEWSEFAASRDAIIANVDYRVVVARAEEKIRAA